jgi:UDP-N-acetylmuramoyl-L-alanyl-D-glutamate--2,6-diaminopimelate ligase
MTLSKILDGVPVTKMFQTMYGKMVVTHDVEIGTLQYDSRKVSAGDLFVALRGTVVDGHTFIDKAVANGAKVVVLEDDGVLPDSYFMHAGVVKIVVADSRKALAKMAANYFDNPSHRIRLIGVTGTNGKTSTTYLMKSILEASGEKVGLIGTIEYTIGDEARPATHTTPESLELNALLAAMLQRGCTAAVMEVSSHSLVMKRVYGLKFAAAVFTNLTQDHLDFHHTMGNYFQAKKILFDGLEADAVAVTNADDPHGLRIIETTAARTLTYSINGTGDVVASNVRVSLAGTTFDVASRNVTVTVTSPLIGRFNVQNMLAAYATATGIGVEAGAIRKGIANLKSVPGRFQHISSPDGWIAVVDYAHTPDALENCLRAIHDIMPMESRGRVITVFGCGGNRDKGKRPQMGRIATELSDVTILTSDNPRLENPDDILAEIRTGCLPGKTLFIEADRRKAIALALGQAQRGDVVLIAGKGHEDYQIIGTQKKHFDDREEVENYIRTRR